MPRKLRLSLTHSLSPVAPVHRLPSPSLLHRELALPTNQKYLYYLQFTLFFHSFSVQTLHFYRALKTFINGSVGTSNNLTMKLFSLMVANVIFFVTFIFPVSVGQWHVQNCRDGVQSPHLHCDLNIYSTGLRNKICGRETIGCKTKVSGRINI